MEHNWFTLDNELNHNKAKKTSQAKYPVQYENQNMKLIWTKREIEVVTQRNEINDQQNYVQQKKWNVNIT